MTSHNSRRDAQSQPRAFADFFCRKKRKHHFFGDFFWNSAAGIYDVQLYIFVVGFDFNADPFFFEWLDGVEGII
ncbi:hypothetical protein D3C86_2137150 [compost metagenome]